MSLQLLPLCNGSGTVQKERPNASAPFNCGGQHIARGTCDPQIGVGRVHRRPQRWRERREGQQRHRRPLRGSKGAAGKERCIAEGILCCLQIVSGLIGAEDGGGDADEHPQRLCWAAAGDGRAVLVDVLASRVGEGCGCC